MQLLLRRHTRAIWQGASIKHHRVFVHNDSKHYGRIREPNPRVVSAGFLN